MKLKAMITIDIDGKLWGFPDDEESIAWFFNKALSTKVNEEQNLILHSNMVGDNIGNVIDVNVIKVMNVEEE